jgi:hypothetical protein
MVRQQLYIGALLLALGASTAVAAPLKRAAPRRAHAHRVARARPAAKRVRMASRPAYRLAARPSGRIAGTRLVSTRGIAGAPRVRRPMLRRTLWVQAATGDGAGMAPDSAAIPREAEPLMLRALGAYYVTGDAPIRELRARGWSFGDIATAGNLAVRSGRPLYQIARGYEDRHDWTLVASDVNVPADDLYAAVNTPRYVMVRPTLEEEARIAAASTAGNTELAAVPPAPGTPETPATPAAPNAAAPPAAAPAPGTAVAPSAPTTPATPEAPGTPGTPAETAPAGAAVPPGAAVAPSAPTAPAGTAPEATVVPEVGTTPEAGASIPPRSLSPAERVAASRLELAPRDQSEILRRAVSTYYALPASTVRELEARGWNLGDILVAGNLAHRSEATLEEIVALHDAGQDWNGVAGRIGVAPEDLYQPTAIRRVTTAP